MHKLYFMLVTSATYPVQIFSHIFFIKLVCFCTYLIGLSPRAVMSMARDFFNHLSKSFCLLRVDVPVTLSSGLWLSPLITLMQPLLSQQQPPFASSKHESFPLLCQFQFRYPVFLQCVHFSSPAMLPLLKKLPECLKLEWIPLQSFDAM